MKRWLAFAGRLGFPEASPARWVAFALLAASLFLLTGVVALSARGGQEPGNLPQHVVAWIYRTFGLSGTIFGLLLVILWAARTFLSGQVPRLGVKAIGVAGVVVSVCGLSGTVAYMGGGALETGSLGQAMAEGLVPLFSRSACVVVFTAMLVGSLLLATNWFFLEEFRALASSQASGARQQAAGRVERQEVTSREERALEPEPAEVLLPRPDPPVLEGDQEAWDPDEEEEQAELPAGASRATEEAESADDPELEAARGQGLLWQEPIPDARSGRGQEPHSAGDAEEIGAEEEVSVEPIEEREEVAAGTEPVKFAPQASDGEEPAVEIPRPERTVALPAPEGSSRPASEDEARPVDSALLDQAAPLIIQTGRASITMLQRQLQIRFAQASQLMEDLERAGVVGPYRGSLPREIRISMEQWQRLRVGDRP